MQGSEKDFIRRLVDNTPHITIGDEFRNPRQQPLQQLYPKGAVDIRGVKPLTETRDIRGFEQILGGLRARKGLARQLLLVRGENITMAFTAGMTRVFKILGIFSTGQAGYDRRQAFVSLKRVQALLNRPNRINSIIMKLEDPYQARAAAGETENQVGYKSVSWQEESEDLLNTLVIRNTIMYTSSAPC